MTVPVPLADIIGVPSGLVSSIVQVWENATPSELAEGTAWYPSAFGIAAGIDPKHPTRAAAVIAALSPQVSWWENVRLARRAYATGTFGGTFGGNCTKARRILEFGEAPSSVLRGPKVQAFYACIADPAEPYAVCVDRHAVAIALGHCLTERERKVLERKGCYDIIAQAYRDAGLILGELPSAVQAITWVSWRNRNASRGVRRAPQVETLF